MLVKIVVDIFFVSCDAPMTAIDLGANSLAIFLFIHLNIAIIPLVGYIFIQCKAGFQ